MGKRKVTDKDIRSIEFAIDSVFIGSSEKAAKQALHSLVEQADEAGKLQNDLDSLRHEFNTLEGTRWRVGRLSMRTGSRLCSATFCMVRTGVHGLFLDRIPNVGFLSAV